MGWLYMQSLGVHKTPKEYLNAQLTYENETASYKVLRSALVKMKRYYAAVQKSDKTVNTTQVFCVVCLVNYNLRDKEGYIFGYKDMDETMGPGVTDCPADILDLLTSTDSEWANEWRDRCRKRLTKVLPKDGQVIVLNTPMRFTDKTTHSRFRVVEHKIGKRKKKMFASEEGMYYRLGDLKDLEFAIEAQAQPQPSPVPETLSLF